MSHLSHRLLVRVPTVTLVVLKMLFVVCCLAQAETADKVALAQQIEAASLRLKLYERQEYPLERRILQAKIIVAKAQVESLARQRAEYQQFTKFKYSAPLFAELERVKVQQVEADQHLKTLQEEKALLERFHQDRMRLLELELRLLQQAL